MLPYPGFLSLTGSEEPNLLGMNNKSGLLTEDMSVKTPPENSRETPTIETEEDLNTKTLSDKQLLMPKEIVSEYKDPGERTRECILFVISFLDHRKQLEL